MVKCDWEIEEICTNSICPKAADCCPVTDCPHICKFYLPKYEQDWEQVAEGYKCTKCGRIYSEVEAGDICACWYEEEED